ncbi:MAG: DUF4349 domain-containing protein [Terracoccus sp.]
MTTIRHWNDIAPARRRTVRLVLAAAAVLLLLASVPLGFRALGGGSSGTSSTPASAGSGGSSDEGSPMPSRPDSAAAAVPAPARVGVPGAPSAARSAVVAPKLARSAWLGLEVTDLSQSSAQTRSVAAGAGGTVTYENVVTGTGPTGSSGAKPARADDPSRATPDGVDLAPVGVDQARLTLNVPAPRLDAVLADLSRLGKVSYRSSQTQDVTDTYVDSQARLAPAKASVARVQALLAEATDLKQVVLIESELSKRQADLDSLTQQLAQLDQQTTMSDVTVTLWTGAAAPSASDNGFIVDLRKAWAGLLGSVTVIVAGLATLLPWLVVLGLLAWVGLRLLHRRSVVTASNPPASPLSPGAGAAPPTA